MIGWAWYLSVAFPLEFLFNIKVYISAYKNRGAATNATAISLLKEALRAPAPGKTKIVVMNHRTRIDWLLLWMLFARAPIVGFQAFKIVLKDALMKVPVFGWATQHLRFIFLSRKWEQDAATIESMCHWYRLPQERTTLVIFPEGTDLSPSNIEKSQTYAKQNGLPVFRYVLTPRHTGLVALKNGIGAENIESVVDLTIGYTDHTLPEERPGEQALLSGRMPRALHFLCHEYFFDCSPHAAHSEPSSIVPFEDAAFQQWLSKRFEAKEDVLSAFYAQQPSSFRNALANPLAASSNGEASRWEHNCDTVLTAESKMSHIRRVLGEVGVVHYVCVPLAWLYITFSILPSLLPLTCYYVLPMVFYFIVSRRGGLGNLLLYGAVQHVKDHQKKK